MRGRVLPIGGLKEKLLAAKNAGIENVLIPVDNVKDLEEIEQEIKTGLKKFGAMLGDYVEVGCNSVLNPGTVIGAHTNVYPLSMVRGVVADHSIYKNRNEVVQKNE